MKIRLFFVLLLVNGFYTAGCADPPSPSDRESDFQYGPHVDLAGYGFYPAPHAAALLELFIPLYQNPTCLFYTDIRALDKSGPAFEANLGLGIRWLNATRQHMYGVYSFYDLKRSSQRNCFNQLMVGSEVWLNTWFLGLNAYLPVGKSKFTDNENIEVQLLPSGNYQNIVYRYGREAAYPGIDLEVGYEWIRGLTFYTGGYYYARSSFPTIVGPLGRLRYIYEPPRNSRFLKALDSITLETQVQYDRPRGTTWYGGLRFSWNLGCTNSSSLSRVARHMIEPPLRDIDVVSQSSPSSFQSFPNSAGSPLQVATVRSKREFEEAIQDPEANLIVVQGTITDLADIALQQNQTITGGDYSFNIKNQSFALNLAQNGTLISSSGNNLLKVSSNNTIRDLTLTLLDPPDTAIGNRAIYNDNTVDDMGRIVVQNVQSNGVIYIDRDGEGKRGSFFLENSLLQTGSWNPSGLAAGVEVRAFNGASVSASLLNNQVFVLTPSLSVQAVGVRLATGAGSSLSVPTFQSNDIQASDAGMVHQLLGGTIQYLGDIKGNRIQGGATGRAGEAGLLSFAFSSSQPSSLSVGSIYDNVFSGSSHSFQISNFGGGSANWSIGSIRNNLFQTAVSIQSIAADTVSIQEFAGNQIQTNAINLTVNTPSFTIRVHDPLHRSLSEANHNATVTLSGSKTPTILTND